MRRNVPSSKILGLAHRLLADDVTRHHVADSDIHAVVRVSDKLRRPLVTLIGVAGLCSLLTRALTLAKAQAPALNMVQVEPDGSLTGFVDDDAQVAEAGVMLIAELLGLIVTFIGEHLMLTLVRDAWPDLLILDDATLEKKLR